ncbi:uncharacterized protein LOC123895887 [Trifolium pratense]|uniref:uncharacterized protein LOC123895887 n=1 Tax=Trifolium pratense TaxID=57577 RepID=UPI001E692D33|nr:uncharacterized protein LOC123895887 [Trifolium pratense]
MFSVKSAYCLMQNLYEPISIDSDLLEALLTMWKNDIPSKVGVFGWRLLLDKLPTRAALASKGILSNPHDLPCVFCFQAVETSHHLFFSCGKAIDLWKQVFTWMGVEASLQVGGRHHFTFFGSLVKSKKGGKVKHLIWLATTWCLWRLRNNIVFRGDFADFSGLLDQIKFVSWLWFSGRAGRKSGYLYHNWCMNPLCCLRSI